MRAHRPLLAMLIGLTGAPACTSFKNDTSSGDAGADADDAGSTEPASCAVAGAGTAKCGVGGTDSCCTSPEVTGGSYDRSYDPVALDGGATLGPDGSAVDESDPATISTYRLDKYLVTVGRFRGFVDAVIPPDGGVGWSPAPGSGKHAHLNGGLGLTATGGGNEPGWVASDRLELAPTDTNLACDTNLTDAATWTQYPGDNEYLPINCINWYEAYAFCIWDGGFLPSEAEWEYAAAGGSEQREYPWGSKPPGTNNQYAIYGTLAPNGPAMQPVCYYPDGMFCNGVAGSIAPVGTATLGAGRWGQLDLAGEMFEWNLDWNDMNGYVVPCQDCADLTPPGSGSPTTGRIVRGGDFESQLFMLVTSSRLYDDPSARTSTVGVRCGRAP